MCTNLQRLAAKQCLDFDLEFYTCKDQRTVVACYSLHATLATVICRSNEHIVQADR